MCGVLAYIARSKTIERSAFVTLNRRLHHRGPDASGVWTSENERIHIGHNRLAIVSMDTGAQPIIKDDIILSVNGEIYNHEELSELLNFDLKKTASDCESIIHVYKRYGPTPEALRLLDGIFSFVLYDLNTNLVWAARDPWGVTSLYYAGGPDAFMVSSEMKALNDVTGIEFAYINEFLPGSMMRYEPTFSATETIQSFAMAMYHPSRLEFWEPECVDNISYEQACKTVKSELWYAVLKRHQMTDVPYGVLLSGGLDSSIIAAIMCKQQRALSPPTSRRIQSFSIGLKGSSDHKAAVITADAIGTDHHQIFFTVQEALDAVPEVIYHLETFDVTTVNFFET